MKQFTKTQKLVYAMLKTQVAICLTLAVCMVGIGQKTKPIIEDFDNEQSKPRSLNGSIKTKVHTEYERRFSLHYPSELG